MNAPPLILLILPQFLADAHQPERPRQTLKRLRMEPTGPGFADADATPRLLQSDSLKVDGPNELPSLLR